MTNLLTIVLILSHATLYYDNITIKKLNKFEPGSSGCALLDENYRVVGQLNGGNNGCVNDAGSYYGRFYYGLTFSAHF